MEENCDVISQAEPAECQIGNNGCETGFLASRQVIAGLSCEEMEAAERLTTFVSNFVKTLPRKKFATRWLAGQIVTRLMEKLQESNLRDDAVAEIAGGVWLRLKRNGNDIPLEGEENDDACDGLEKIAEDIARKFKMFEMGLSVLVPDWMNMLAAAGPEASPRVIAFVARRMWPSIKNAFEFGI